MITVFLAVQRKMVYTRQWQIQQL